MAESLRREDPSKEEGHPTPFMEHIERLGGNGDDKKESAHQQTTEDAAGESDSSIGFIERLGEEPPTKEKKAGKRLGGASAADWGWTGAAAIAGIPLTIGRALEYALFGWELDSNGWPKIDKQSIAHVDKWHNKVAGVKG